MIIPDTGVLGQSIRNARAVQGLSQAALSEIALVSTHFLSDLERGKPTVEVGKVLKVLQTLGLEVYVVPRGAKYD